MQLITSCEPDLNNATTHCTTNNSALADFQQMPSHLVEGKIFLLHIYRGRENMILQTETVYIQKRLCAVTKENTAGRVA